MLYPDSSYLHAEVILAQLGMSFEQGKGCTGAAKYCPVWKKKKDSELSPEYK